MRVMGPDGLEIVGAVAFHSPTFMHEVSVLLIVIRIYILVSLMLLEERFG